MNKQGVALQDIVSFANQLLEVAEIEDCPGAVNGLQLENSGVVSKIGAAVDASTRTIELAIDESVDLLVVHHGMFWGGVSPVTRQVYRHSNLRRSRPSGLSKAGRKDVFPRLAWNWAS
jgi:putative NIF3 family GTP cyclohydrolase 1 type 2